MDGEMKVIAQYLELLRSCQQTHAREAGYEGETMATLLLKHGVEYTAPVRPRPQGVRKMTDKMCFRNAANMVVGDSSLIYVEGYAASSIGFPCHHAWVVTRTGVLIDPTWRKVGTEYFGIPFNREYLFTVMARSGVYGILDNWKFRDILTDSPHEFLSTEDDYAPSSELGRFHHDGQTTG